MTLVRRFALMLVLAAIVLAGPFASDSGNAELQFQLGNLLFEDTRYHEAITAYRNAMKTDDAALQLRARIGLVTSQLRVGQFVDAQRDAKELRTLAPNNPEALTSFADALWAAGQFDDAEQTWRDALTLAPESSRGLHGLARAQASQSKMEEALDTAQAALKHAPRDAEIHHTVGSIYERMRQYEQAAAAYNNYINLLPNKDRSDKAAWSRSQVRFLKSFGENQPIALDEGSIGRLHTMDFRIVDEKVIVKAKVNGGRNVDFVLDTGSELTTLSRQTASASNVRPITYTLSAGVGEVGLRGLQLGRMETFEVGTLRLKNVPVLIKAPALRGIPKKETESFSPLALGFSMTIDYKAKKLTIGADLPEETADVRLGLRHHRLAMVRGLINGTRQTYFVVDTGGEVISISTATADALAARPGRKIALKVYGTSGWDREAFLLPGVTLNFDDISYKNFSVVVLNLRAPSVLLGFEVGGIVGHKFLSPYRVSLDLAKSEVRLSKAN
jgi:Flp pilus assembly protein TadD/predicted aspartyl protease